MQNFYTTYRPEFSQLETWRPALPHASLMIYNDPEWGALDAPEYVPAGSTVWRLLISRGIGPHEYGAASTKTRRI